MTLPFWHYVSAPSNTLYPQLLITVAHLGEVVQLPLSRLWCVHQQATRLRNRLHMVLLVINYSSPYHLTMSFVLHPVRKPPGRTLLRRRLFTARRRTYTNAWAACHHQGRISTNWQCRPSIRRRPVAPRRPAPSAARLPRPSHLAHRQLPHSGDLCEISTRK